MGFLDSLKEIFAGFQDNLKKTYYFFEDKWYNLLDRVDKHVPVYKIIDPIDKVIPSFILFILLILFLFILTGYLMQFSSQYEVIFLVSDSETKENLNGVKLSGTINDSIFEKTTNSLGEARISALGVKRNFYGLIWQVLTNEKDSLSAIITAKKDSYKTISRKEMDIISYKNKILLEKEAIRLDANYPSSTKVKLVDEDTYETIIDSDNTGYVKFKCNNKTINPSVKTVTDNADGLTDGKFTLNENNCAFVVSEAYSEGYEIKSGMSFALPINNDEHEISLTRLEEPNTGNAKITVIEHGSSPEKRLVGVEVSLISEAGTTLEDYTDNSGVAEFYDLPTGKYEITAINPDGNHYALTLESNLDVVVPKADTNELKIKMVKLNPEDVRIVKVKFVDSEDLNEPISGVKMQLYLVSTDKNGDKYANGGIKGCKNGCNSDSNGIVTVTGLDSTKAGKLIAVAFKEGYVYKVFIPELFKTGLGPEIIELEEATESNTGEARILVKSKANEKPIVGARAFLYLNSPLLEISKIKILESGKITDINGRAEYIDLPMGTYYANASFAGKKSSDSNSAAIDVGEGVHQIITLNVRIDTNISAVKIKLYDGSTRALIQTPVSPRVKLYEVDANFTPKTFLEDLSFNIIDKSFNSSGYEPRKKVLVTIDLNGYASNFVTIDSLKEGENELSVLMYPLSEIDSNLEIFFNGLYLNATDIDSLEQAVFFQRDHEAYYAKIDIVLTREIDEGEILSMLRIDGPMSSEGIPYKTAYNYFTSESFSCKPLSRINAINDNNYYFPPEAQCIQGNRVQSAINWGPSLRAGTYSFVVKIKFDPAANEDDIVKLSFRAKEDLNNYSYETPLFEKSFYVDKPLCEPTEPNCPKIFFNINLNENVLSSNSNLTYYPEEKSFKSQDTIPLLSKAINNLEVSIYNNSGTSATPTLRLYSYEGFWGRFNSTPSGELYFGDSNTSPKTKEYVLSPIPNKIRSEIIDENVYPNFYNQTQYLIFEVILGSEKYYAYVDTKALGREVKIDTEFVAALINQQVDGQVTSAMDNNPIDLRGASFTTLRNCRSTNPSIATTADGTPIENMPFNVVDNYFEKIVPGIYAYNTDCMKVSVTPSSSNFDDSEDTFYAGFGGAIDPTLACINIRSPQNLAEDFSLEWNANTKITVVNNCSEEVSVILESDLVFSPQETITINTGRSQEYIIIGRNKTFDPDVKFSDVLGVFPLYIKAKPLAATRKRYSIADSMRVHLVNENDCFAISKDLFDFTSESADNSFKIQSHCQYTLIDDYYVPKARINSFGVDINMFQNQVYDGVDFNWEVKMTGGTYQTNYTTSTIDSRGNVHAALLNIENSEDLGDRRKYVCRIDMSEDNLDTSELWIKLNDKVDDFNIYGASIDGDIKITKIDDSVITITPLADFNIDWRRCQCSGVDIESDACHAVGVYDNYCVTGREDEGDILEGFMYSNVHLILPSSIKIKYIDFNLTGNSDNENLSYFITPLGTTEVRNLVITSSSEQETKTILSGEFRIYPLEGITYILQDLGRDKIAGLTTDNTDFLELINPNVKVETSNIRSNGENLSSGVVIVWVEGRFLKARFFGKDNPVYNSGEIEMELQKTFAAGTQYSIINIKDYVNKGKIRNE